MTARSLAGTFNLVPGNGNRTTLHPLSSTVPPIPLNSTTRVPVVPTTSSLATTRLVDTLPESSFGGSHQLSRSGSLPLPGARLAEARRYTSSATSAVTSAINSPRTGIQTPPRSQFSVVADPYKAQIATMSFLRCAQQIFVESDTSGSGSLDWKNGEIRNFVMQTFRRQGLPPPSEELVGQLYLNSDSSKDGQLPMRECLQLVEQLHQQMPLNSIESVPPLRSSSLPTSPSRRIPASPKTPQAKVVDDVSRDPSLDSWLSCLDVPPLLQTSALTYKGRTVNFQEVASMLGHTVVANTQHFPRMVEVIDKGIVLQHALQMFRILDRDRNGVLTWNNGEIRNFVTAVMGELGLTAPSEKQIYAIYTEFDQDCNSALDARECICMVDAIIRGIFHERVVQSEVASQPTSFSHLRQLLLDREMRLSAMCSRRYTSRTLRLFLNAWRQHSQYGLARRSQAQRFLAWRSKAELCSCFMVWNARRLESGIAKAMQREKMAWQSMRLNRLSIAMSMVSRMEVSGKGNCTLLAFQAWSSLARQRGSLKARRGGMAETIQKAVEAGLRSTPHHCILKAWRTAAESNRRARQLDMWKDLARKRGLLGQERAVRFRLLHNGFVGWRSVFIDKFLACREAGWKEEQRLLHDQAKLLRVQSLEKLFLMSTKDKRVILRTFAQGWRDVIRSGKLKAKFALKWCEGNSSTLRHACFGEWRHVQLKAAGRRQAEYGELCKQQAIYAKIMRALEGDLKTALVYWGRVAQERSKKRHRKQQILRKGLCALEGEIRTALDAWIRFTREAQVGRRGKSSQSVVVRTLRLVLEGALRDTIRSWQQEVKSLRSKRAKNLAAQNATFKAIRAMLEGVLRFTFSGWSQYCIKLRNIRTRNDAVSIALRKALEGDRRGIMHACFIGWSKILENLERCAAVERAKKRMHEAIERYNLDFLLLSVLVCWKEFVDSKKIIEAQACVKKLYEDNATLTQQLNNITTTLQAEITTKLEITEQLRDCPRMNLAFLNQASDTMVSTSIWMETSTSRGHHTTSPGSNRTSPALTPSSSKKALY